jgi:non-heme chloroperoxidase
MPRFVLPDGRTLAYAQYGRKGPPVVLLHGYLDSHVTFFRLVERLSQEHQLFIPDQRGHGNSDAAPGYDIAGFTADAIAFIAGLDIAPVHLGGHSLGGIVAQRVAAARPDLVQSLALISTARHAGGNQALQETVPLLRGLTDPVPDELARAFQGSSCFAPLPEEILARLLDETRKVTADVWRGALAGLLDEPAPRDAVSDIPTQILWGEDDGIFPAADQERLRRHFPEAGFTAYRQTGHAPNWERPAETAAALLGFWRAFETEEQSYG